MHCPTLLADGSTGSKTEEERHRDSTPPPTSYPTKSVTGGPTARDLIEEAGIEVKNGA